MVTVHHLNLSRSTRVLWLLEEIGAPYRIVTHVREPGFRAPASLRAVHPLGKAPVIEDEGLVIAESAVILDYIDGRYAGGRFTPDEPENRIRHAEMMQVAETALGASLTVNFYGQLTGGLTGTFASIIARDTDAALAHVETRIAGAYLMGDGLTLADLQLAYPLAVARYLGFLHDYPRSADYLARLEEREALRRAIAAGGPMTPPA